MANSNKILFITSEFPPQPGGIGNHAYNLAKHLNKEGICITVLADIRSGNGEQEKKFDDQLNFEVRRVKRRSIIWISYLDRVIKAKQLITNANTVFASGKFSLWLVFFLKLFYSKKYIAIIHGSELMLPNKCQRKFTYKSLKKFNQIIAVSNYTKNLIKDLNLNTIEVIPNGFSVANDKFNPPIQNKPDYLNLITVGNVTQRKGQQNVVKAIPELLQRFPNLQYHIVGIPTERTKIENLAKELNVLNHIIFHGKVSEGKKWELLHSSSIFLMLSETTESGDVEGFGIAILEANSIGVPAIGSKGCGIEDAIDNGNSGILVDYQNSEMIVNAVHEIYESYEQFSENAKHWSKKFSWNKIVKQYLGYIDK